MPEKDKTIEDSIIKNVKCFLDISDNINVKKIEINDNAFKDKRNLFRSKKYTNKRQNS